MKVIVIGSSYCQDTLYALMKLKDAGAKTEFRNISTNFMHLKEFCFLREKHPLYVKIKENDMVGMPFMRMEDGTETLDFNEVIAKLK